MDTTSLVLIATGLGAYTTIVYAIVRDLREDLRRAQKELGEAEGFRALVQNQLADLARRMVGQEKEIPQRLSDAELTTAKMEERLKVVERSVNG